MSVGGGSGDGEAMCTSEVTDVAADGGEAMNRAPLAEVERCTHASEAFEATAAAAATGVEEGSEARGQCANALADGGSQAPASDARALGPANWGTAVGADAAV